MTAGRKNTNTKKDWNTPPKYTDLVHEFFDNDLELDPCSNENSTVIAKTTYTEKDDGMAKSWYKSSIFVNPPYGKGNKYNMYDWLKKGKEASEDVLSDVLYLIPVATNTKHFKELVFKTEGGICFLEDTRLKFWADGQEMAKGAPMACCFVYFGNNYDKFLKHFENFGKCFEL